MARQHYELGVGLTDEHRTLAAGVADFAEETITPDIVREHLDSNDEPKFPAFWDAMSGMELLGLHIPQERGGSGGGLLTLVVALEALGRRVLPGSFLTTAWASAVLAADAGGAADELIGKLIDGSTTATVALGEPGELTRSGDGARLSGSWDAVLGAPNADVILLPARSEGVVVWVAVDADQVDVTAQHGLDLVRGSGRVQASGADVSADRVLGNLTPQRVTSISVVVLGGEALGITSWCVNAASEYAKIREQFGRPIGQFQGVKHKCAWMGITLEKARAALWDAASALDRGDETAAFAAAVAGVIVPDGAVTTAQDCIQVHGGIGFTWEHDAHLYYRRALGLRGVLGTHDAWSQRLAELSLAGTTRPIDIELPEEASAIRETARAELAGLVGLDEDEQLTRLGDEGWVQPHLPKPFGRAASPLEQIVIGQEIGSAGIALPQLLMGSWAVGAIVGHGTEQQKKDLAAPTLRGDFVWCQLFSEPGAGSDLAALSTKATKVDGGWKVSGQKIWTTVAQFSDWAMLIARTDPSAPKHQGITYFVLDMSTPGVTVTPLRELTGSALFNQVFLDDVFIPDENVVGEVNDGWRVARTTLAGERVALSQKMEAYATDSDLIKFVQGRELGPVARAHYGELIADSQAVDLIGARVVLKQLSGADVSTTSSVGKLLAMQIGQGIAEFVIAELGAAGAVSVPGQGSDKAMEQLLAGRATTIYGGTTEVQLNVIGERMLGLPRDAAPAR